MLLNLKIENIAIIEKAVIDFSDGLNVLTGETGSGKSIIIDSINAVLGERTSRDLIRTGADTAKVTAFFTKISNTVKEIMSQQDIPIEEDDSLLIQRTINADGRNICRINGSVVTVSMLKNIGRELINIHGQHDSQSLLSPEKHYTYVDNITENAILRSQYHQAYSEFSRLAREIENLSVDDAQKAQKIDLLRYQIEELESASIRGGEREELTQQRDFYLNSEKIISNLHTAYDAINGSDELQGAQQQLFSAAECLSAAARYYPEIEKLSQDILEMSYTLSEYSDELRDTLLNLEYNPQELETIEERLDILYRLSRKYGQTEEEMLQYLAQAKAELETIEFSEERLEQLKINHQQAQKKALKLAQELTASRKKAGQQFAQQVMEELSFLDMPSVKFEVSHQQKELGANGADWIEFLISVNAGEPPKPLSKIASGGELSRIMLAIKNVISDKDDIATLIFDEIDTGVSGRAAQKIALKLSSASAGRQVICVTHLAQIAAQADNHLLIEKKEHDNRTFTDIFSLDFEGRKQELARITGGLEITKAQLESAAELLKAANKC